MEDYAYVLGCVLGDASAYATPDHVKHVLKDGTVRRYPKVNYRITMICISEAFACRFADALGRLRGTPLTPKRFIRANFNSGLPGIRPNYVFNGWRIGIKSKDLVLRLRHDRDALLAGQCDWDAENAMTILTGIVDSDGYVAPGGSIVIRSSRQNAIMLLCAAAGVRATPRAEVVPSVYIPAVDARTIPTWKRPKPKLMAH